MRNRAAILAVAVTAAFLAGPALASAAPLAGRGPGANPAAAGVISTLAGGVGGPAAGTGVAIAEPCGLTAQAGSFYAGDSGSVRKVTQATGFLTTPAGTGSAGPLGDGGPATVASISPANLSGTCGVAVDNSGNLVLTDGLGNRIRVVAASSGTFYGQAMSAGDIYTVAGNGTAGFAGDGGPATSAELDGPGSLAVDGQGNLLIADTTNGRVRVVAARTGTFYGRIMTGGDIYTLAGGGTNFPGNGGPATSADIAAPTGVAVDGAGNLVITDDSGGLIRVVAVSTGTFYGQAMTAGDIYTVAGNGVFGFAGDGGPAASAEFRFPNGVALDRHGNVLIADSGNGRIRVVAASTGRFYGQAMTAGDIYTVAGKSRGHSFSGDGGPARMANLCSPIAVTADGSGNLLIADFCNNRVRVVAAGTGRFYGQAMTAGDIYTVAGNGTASDSGFAIPAVRAEISDPEGVAVDANGNVVLGDTGNSRVQVVAASTGTFFGRAMTAGHIYVLAGDGTAGFSGDGGPGDIAEVNAPQGVALDMAGNVVFADTANSRVRVVAARSGTFYGQAMTAGGVYTVAGNGTLGFSGDGGPATGAELTFPFGVGVDGSGNLLIADTLNNRVRVVAARSGTFYGQAMTAGDIYTVAGDGNTAFSGDGGPATSAGMDPQAVTVDQGGNLVIADRGNGRIRVVAARTGTFYGQAMTAGDIYTVAGGGSSFPGNGGPATSAQLNGPWGTVVDSAGNLVFADTGPTGGQIRVVAARTGTFYGQAMTAGDLYTVAGIRAVGFAGDGGLATRAELSLPAAVAVTAQGGLVIADSFNNRIRAVAG